MNPVIINDGKTNKISRPVLLTNIFVFSIAYQNVPKIAVIDISIRISHIKSPLFIVIIFPHF